MQGDPKMNKFNRGDKAFIITNGKYVTPVTVLNNVNGFCTIKFEKGAGSRVRESKLYKTYQEAASNIRVLI